MSKNNNIPQPFVKWVGGKRQLLGKILPKVPKEFNNYYEPFIGGGAVFFNLDIPNKAFINDINGQLINTYLKIKDNSLELISYLDDLNEGVYDLTRYLSIRERFNEKILKNEDDVESPALFITLNKYCFNGVYRVNKKGLFNVPWNKKEFVNTYEKENIEYISKKLQKTEIYNEDFTFILKNAKKGDFIFFDSPYAPLNDNSFDAYTKTGFSKEDHIRLSEEFKRLDRLGCYIILTNHNTDLIRELYKDFNIEEVNVKRMVNSDSSKRFGKEVIITNY